MSLKIADVKTIELDDWDNFVKEQYGLPYCFQQQDGCKYRGTTTINVPDDEWYDYENEEMPVIVNGPVEGIKFDVWKNTPKDAFFKNDDSYKADLFWSRNYYPHVSMIINDLYDKGLIEKGTYNINIDW